MDKPKRKFNVMIHIEADHWDGVMRELSHILVGITDNPRVMLQSVSEYSDYTFECENDHDMTHTRYVEQLGKYLEEQEASKS